MLSDEQLTVIRRVWERWRSGERPDAAQRLLHQDLPMLITDLATLRARCEKLEAALRWYADEANWCDGYGPGLVPCGHKHFVPGVPFSPITYADCGERARTALAPTDGDGERKETR